MGNNAELFPVLSTFFEKKAEMLSLRHLPSFFRWLDLVMERFDKNIDRSAARTVTLGSVMEPLPYSMQKRMVEELSPASAMQILEVIDTACNFLGSATFELGSSVGDKTL